MDRLRISVAAAAILAAGSAHAGEVDPKTLAKVEAASLVSFKGPDKGLAGDLLQQAFVEAVFKPADGSGLRTAETTIPGDKRSKEVAVKVVATEVGKGCLDVESSVRIGKEEGGSQDTVCPSSSSKSRFTDDRRSWDEADRRAVSQAKGMQAEAGAPNPGPKGSIQVVGDAPKPVASVGELPVAKVGDREFAPGMHARVRHPSGALVAEFPWVDPKTGAASRPLFAHAEGVPGLAAGFEPTLELEGRYNEPEGEVMAKVDPAPGGKNAKCRVEIANGSSPAVQEGQLPLAVRVPARAGDRIRATVRCQVSERLATMAADGFASSPTVTVMTAKSPDPTLTKEMQSLETTPKAVSVVNAATTFDWGAMPKAAVPAFRLPDGAAAKSGLAASWREVPSSWIAPDSGALAKVEAKRGDAGGMQVSAEPFLAEAPSVVGGRIAMVDANGLMAFRSPGKASVVLKADAEPDRQDRRCAAFGEAEGRPFLSSPAFGWTPVPGASYTVLAGEVSGSRSDGQPFFKPVSLRLGCFGNASGKGKGIPADRAGLPVPGTKGVIWSAWVKLPDERYARRADDGDRFVHADR